MERRHTVTILPANVSFECAEDEPILKEALNNGFSLPYGCRKGNCGTCKAQLLDGEAVMEDDSSHALSSFEVEQGFTLICCAYPVSNLVIEMEGIELGEVNDLVPPARFGATVTEVAELTHDIRHLKLRLDGELRFRAGQFAELEVPGTDAWRSYSMANSPSSTDELEFMIKLVPGGLFSGLLSTLGPGTPLNVRAPHGAFWLRDQRRPLLMIGGGAGMAPLWSMLQYLVENDDQRRVVFVYGARTHKDLFHQEEIRSYGEKLKDFEFIPALSHADPSADPHYRHGLVTDVVSEVLGDSIRRHDAYLCGPPPMIDAGLDLLARHGLEERRSIFFDKFTAS